MQNTNGVLLITALLASSCLGRTVTGTKSSFEQSITEAKRGNSRAQYLLALRYLDADGVAPNVEEGRKWLLKSAAQSYGPSETQLGWLAEEGVGQSKNLGEARKWYERAVDHGSLWGMNNLGRMYLMGSSVSPDYGRAFELFQKAWLHSPSARFNLGLMYELGLGRSKDLAEACAWYTVAAETDNHPAAVARDRLKKQLSASELDRLQKRVNRLHLHLAWDRIEEFLSSKVYPVQYLLDFLICLQTLIYLIWPKKKRLQEQVA